MTFGLSFTSAATEVSTSSTSIPVIDLAAWTSTSSIAGNDALHRDEVVQQIGTACTTVGFFAIQNHGFNATRLEALWKATRDFFDLPLDTKLESKTHNETDYPYGYEQSETLVVGKTLDASATTADERNDLPPPPDQKETFSMGPSNPLAGMPPRRFPPRPPELQVALTEYYQEMEHLTSTLLELFALALDLAQDWFQDKMTRHMSALRLLNYFPSDDNDNFSEEDGGGDGEPVVRAGAHTDYGALTILKPGGPGLQVQPARQGDHNNNNTSAEWLAVPYLPDAFIVNLGDLMQRWTNDKWKSTLHRVVNTEKRGRRRQSIAYFANVNGDTPVETLETCIDDHSPKKYPVVLAKDHLMAKHLASMRLGEDNKKDKEATNDDAGDKHRSEEL